MNGPCLCGDPHCSSCGDPSLEKFDDAINLLCEKIEKEKFDEMELTLLINYADFIISNRHVINDEFSKRSEGDVMYIDHLEYQLDRYTNRSDYK